MQNLMKQPSEFIAYIIIMHHFSYLQRYFIFMHGIVVMHHKLTGIINPTATLATLLMAMMNKDTTCSFSVGILEKAVLSMTMMSQHASC